MGLQKYRRLHRATKEILYKPKSTHAHTTYPPQCRPRATASLTRAVFSPPPSISGKRYALALPSLACLGRASSGTGWPCRGRAASHRRSGAPWCGPRVVGSMRPWQGVISSGARLLLVEGALGLVSVRSPARTLRRPRLGTLLRVVWCVCVVCLFSPRYAIQGCDATVEERAASPDRMRTSPTCQTPFRVFWKRSFVGVNSNGGRGFVTSSPRPFPEPYMALGCKA